MYRLDSAITVIMFCGILSVACSPASEAFSTQTSTASTAIAADWTKTPTPVTSPTQTATITPTPQPTSTPTPEFSEVFNSKSQGIQIRYPTGWKVSEDEFQITVEKDDVSIGIFFYPAEAQSQFDNNPIFALESYISFVGYSPPDREWIHLKTLNNSVSALGAYKNPGEEVGFSPPAPLFIAIHFTKVNIIAMEMHAPPGNYDDYKKIFELVLGSLPPSPPFNAVISPTRAPHKALVLPSPPSGLNWQGVENIEFALPVPDNWHVKLFKIQETWQNGLQEYHYQYVITKENLDIVGKFKSGLVVSVLKNNGINAYTYVKRFNTEAKTSSNIKRVITTSSSESSKTIASHLHAEAIDEDVEIDDPTRDRIIYTVAIANISKNIFYTISFDAPTKSWDQEWLIGQKMLQLLLNYLEQ